MSIEIYGGLIEHKSKPWQFQSTPRIDASHIAGKLKIRQPFFKFERIFRPKRQVSKADWLQLGHLVATHQGVDYLEVYQKNCIEVTDTDQPGGVIRDFPQIS